MSKFRVVKFKNGDFGIQKKNFFGFWFTQGSEDCDIQGFPYAWQPFVYKTSKLAKKSIRQMDLDKYRAVEVIK